MATNRQLATVGVAAAGVVAAALLAGRLRRYALKFLIGRASAGTGWCPVVAASFPLCLLCSYLVLTAWYFFRAGCVTCVCFLPEPAAPKWVYAAIKALSPSKPSTFYFEDLLPRYGESCPATLTPRPPAPLPWVRLLCHEAN